MYQPLADLLRPTTLDEVFGQEHILGQGAISIEILSFEAEGVLCMSNNIPDWGSNDDIL